MNPLAKLQLAKDKKDLASTALEVECLLRKAGDLAERVDSHEQLGYLFISGLDQENLTAYAIGRPALLAEMLVEAGRRNPQLAEILRATALELS